MGQLKFYLPTIVCLKRANKFLTLVWTFGSVCLHFVLWMLEASIVLHEFIWSWVSSVWLSGGHNLPLSTWRLKSRRGLLAMNVGRFQNWFLWKERRKELLQVLFPYLLLFLLLSLLFNLFHPAVFGNAAVIFKVTEPPHQRACEWQLLDPFDFHLCTYLLLWKSGLLDWAEA